MGLSGLPRVRTELSQLLVIPSSPPHPVQAHRELARHRYLHDATFATHRQEHELASPVPIGTYRGLRRLHQEEVNRMPSSHSL